MEYGKKYSFDENQLVNLLAQTHKIYLELGAAAGKEKIRDYLYTSIQVLESLGIDTSEIRNSPIIIREDISIPPTDHELSWTAVQLVLLRKGIK